MKNDITATNPLEAPTCMKEETKLITGKCPKCGEELEFFSVPELHNTKYCPKCKETLDTKSIAKQAGYSV